MSAKCEKELAARVVCCLTARAAALQGGTPAFRSVEIN